MGGGTESFRYGSSGRFDQGPGGTYSYGSVPSGAPEATVQGGVTTGEGYDAAGEETSGRLPAITWDALGRVRTIGTGAVTLPVTEGMGDGLVEVGGERFLGRWLVESGGGWSARIRMPGGEVVGEVKSTGATEYLVPDALGSTAAVVSSAGVLLDRVAYGPWGSFVNPESGTGEVAADSVARFTHVTYTGHELIARAGLIDMGARMYDPALGQFLSPDPLLSGHDPYVYVQDNPLSRIDPLGLETKSDLCDTDPSAASCNGGQSSTPGQGSTTLQEIFVYPLLNGGIFTSPTIGLLSTGQTSDLGLNLGGGAGMLVATASNHQNHSSCPKGGVHGVNEVSIHAGYGLALGLNAVTTANGTTVTLSNIGIGWGADFSIMSGFGIGSSSPLSIEGSLAGSLPDAPILGELQGAVGNNGLSGKVTGGFGFGYFGGIGLPLSAKLAHFPFALPWSVTGDSPCH